MSTTTRRHLLAATGLAAGGLAAPGAGAPALAQQAPWPMREVRYVIPIPPGGTTDVVGRLVAQTMAAQTGQPFVVENLPGAGSTVGAARAARMPADGTTLFMSQIASHGIAPALYPRIEYDPLADFAAVAHLVSVPNLLVANPQKVAARTLPELIAAAKAAPGRITAASSGNGTSTHLSIILLNMLAGIELLHVPYRGAGPALIAITGGEVDLFIDNMPSVLPHVQAGRLVPLAVTSRTRSATLPDVPSVAEAGAALGTAEYEAVAWFGLHTPKPTPATVVAAMNAGVNRALADPTLRKRLEDAGNTVVGGPPATFDAFVRGELEKWGRVVRSANVKVD
jgi:tripartite-type tricarboxylate transporter receptor subunit TctC